MRLAHNPWALEPQEFRQAVHLRSVADNIMKIAIGEAWTKRDHIDASAAIFNCETLTETLHKSFGR